MTANELYVLLLKSRAAIKRSIAHGEKELTYLDPIIAEIEKSMRVPRVSDKSDAELLGLRE